MNTFCIFQLQMRRIFTFSLFSHSYTGLKKDVSFHVWCFDVEIQRKSRMNRFSFNIVYCGRHGGAVVSLTS